MLECVVNVSEGRDPTVLGALDAATGASRIDLHSDYAHHRAVFTLAGPDVAGATRRLTAACVERLDLREHTGVHPRLGVVDVVPFVPLGEAALDPNGDLSEATKARDGFARWAADELALPCFVYGPERTLPEVRRHAFADLSPDFGPPRPHPTAGACCVGARRALVAYNLVLETNDPTLAREIAAEIRSPEVRALGFGLDDAAQVSCNLVAPGRVGPADVYERVAKRAPIRRAELVGLIPRQVLAAIEKERWGTLGLSEASTIEARLAMLDPNALC